MPKIKYIDLPILRNKEHLSIVAQANTIITEYQAQGFVLTLRQLYYQFVSRDLIKNTQKDYKRLGSIINDARLAGLIDWSALEDRTRNLAALAHWTDPTQIIESCASQFRVDLWAGQQHHVEVWIEKDALVGVIEGVCQEYDVPFFSCRGYTSQSEMWEAGQRLLRYRKHQQPPVILHFGDHDPSGIDMTRDIEERLSLFMGGLEVRRMALNFDQVEEYQPPPNPAKISDPRAGVYIVNHGDESWELDALEPAVIADLIRQEIETLIDRGPWNDALADQRAARSQLGAIAERFEDVKNFLAS